MAVLREPGEPGLSYTTLGSQGISASPVLMRLNIECLSEYKVIVRVSGRFDVHEGRFYQEPVVERLCLCYSCARITLGGVIEKKKRKNKYAI